MKEITVRQQEILDGVIKYSLDNNRYPTIRECQGLFGMSAKGIYDHVQALRKKGAIRIDNGKQGIKAKGLKIVMEKENEL
jgi:repressor LexA